MFTVTMGGREHVFDSFECAARAFPQLGSTVLPETWDAALQGMVPSAAVPSGLGRQARWKSAAETGLRPYPLDDDES
jgi:membrane carboxypeptidase/penicillin-binding protein